MADQPTPPTPAERSEAQDPSNSYERSHPDRESGMGRLDNNTNATPERRPDKTSNAVPNAQDPTRQVNAEDVIDDRGRGAPAAEQPDHSMHEEEPNGWDMAPTDIHDPKQKRHPRTEGKGGTP